ncbi:uncharacterized protein N7511_000030 [Penicillium nucicola]|uniref:uncharacterized protein n=1 Tax=Penicillium nucicola TaxID=1850975 RepID=UPI002544E043|nr:uncharacterized protein N7511_000030 [Penicillium nucicola]KAJ5775019.1 hypothetical protein N7511_000030 [Penicillium nucicola]
MSNRFPPSSGFNSRDRSPQRFGRPPVGPRGPDDGPAPFRDPPRGPRALAASDATLATASYPHLQEAQMAHLQMAVTSTEEACEGAAVETGKVDAVEAARPFSTTTAISFADEAVLANHGADALIA